MNREGWLLRLSKIMDRELFDNQMPKYRVTCGFPSQRGVATKGKVIGQHWPAIHSTDETHELIVSITIDEPVLVAGTLAHEMIHALCPNAGHRGEFREHALRIGLTGKMTATEEGPKFIEWVTPHLKELGPYPHARINYEEAAKIKKQSTRMIKCECETCGYIVRTSRKQIDENGMPVCANPTHGPMYSEYESTTKPKPRLGTWTEITPQEPTGEMSVFVCRKGEPDSVEWIKKWVHTAYAESFTHWMPAPPALGVRL